MSELSKIADAWKAACSRRGEGALATVIRTHGSTFRRPGARMLILDDGTTVGSVSGGCLESSIIDAASEVIRSGRSTVMRYDGARDDVVLGEGAMCDGEVAIAVEKIEGALSDALRGLAEAGHQQDLLIVVHEDEIRGATTRIDTVVQPFAERMVLFQERVQPPLQVVLCGAGALAGAVAGLAEMIGWDPVVVDHRPHFLASMTVPTRQVRGGDDLAELIARPSGTALVVMTHHFERDLSLLEGALRVGPSYVGLLGSRRRSARLVEELERRNPGIDLSMLHAPVGLDIGSETIEEIALSIVSEIQAVRRGAEGGRLRQGVDPVHGRGSARLAAVILAAGGSSRMGSPKLLLEGPSGESLIRETIETVRSLDLNDLLVVEGAEPGVGSVAQELGVRRIVNENWEAGLGSTIRLAVDSLGEDIDGLLVMLADQPKIGRRDLAVLVESWRGTRAPVVATSYPEGGGVPAVFSRTLFDELRRIEGDRGARDLIRSLDEVELVELRDTRDVDDRGSYEEVIGDSGF